MDATDLTIQPLVLLPRAQGDSQLAALLDLDADYAQWGDALADPAPAVGSPDVADASGWGQRGQRRGESRAREAAAGEEVAHQEPEGLQPLQAAEDKGEHPPQPLGNAPDASRAPSNPPKCSEARPACSYCVKKGFRCEYPAAPTVVHQVCPAPRILKTARADFPGQPHDSIPLFSMQDMRCFQHFILRCYPHHPVANEDVWTHEVPCLSHTVSPPSPYSLSISRTNTPSMNTSCTPS